MTEGWSLPVLFADLHAKIERELASARTLGHPTDKGDASERVWINVLNEYLPRRYEARKGFVVDSLGAFSQQIDVIVHDRQYSPFVFRFMDTEVVPAESVYAVFEAKQDLTAEHVRYAGDKAASVRRLHRTSLPAQTIDHLSRPKPLHRILAGSLTLAAKWNPPLDQTLGAHLGAQPEEAALDIGCVANAGWFLRAPDGYAMHAVNKAATRFLFELIAQLQAIGTAPMLDVRAYARMI